MAFTASTFLGISRPPRGFPPLPAAPRASIVCATPAPGRSKIWEAYQAFANAPKGFADLSTFDEVLTARKPGPAPVDALVAMAAASEPGPRSKIWSAYQTSTNPYDKAAAAAARTFLTTNSTELRATRVDNYIADCARRQYIMSSNASGVYGVACTEGGTRGAADDARVAALTAQFRVAQSSRRARLADAYETRRRATVLSQGCSYEEGLVRRFKRAADAVVLGNSELSAACSRYADPQTVAEKYMVACVERAASSRATSGGVYDAMCADGGVRGEAEGKRVRALALKFRNGQRGALAKEAAKFEVARFARENYAGMCEYEEGLFGRFPAAAAAMRPDSARY